MFVANMVPLPDIPVLVTTMTAGEVRLFEKKNPAYVPQDTSLTAVVFSINVVTLDKLNTDARI